MLLTAKNKASSGHLRSYKGAEMKMILCATGISFPTIRNNFKEQLFITKCYIAAATHDDKVKCGAGGHPKSSLIRTDTTL